MSEVVECEELTQPKHLSKWGDSCLWHLSEVVSFGGLGGLPDFHHGRLCAGGGVGGQDGFVLIQHCAVGF